MINRKPAMLCFYQAVVRRSPQRLDQRGLSGAVVADDREDLAGIEIEVGMIHRGDAAVALDQLPPDKNGFDAHLETLRIH